MKWENWPLVNKPVDFEKYPVGVQDIRKRTHHFIRIYGIYLNLIKKIQKITTCNKLDLTALGFWPIMPKNIHRHWISGAFILDLFLNIHLKTKFNILKNIDIYLIFSLNIQYYS